MPILCSGNVFDTEGVSGDYSINENATTTYIAPLGSLMELSFNSLDLELNYDYIYDGSFIRSPLMYTITGSDIPQLITSSGRDNIKFYIRWIRKWCGI